ncbi:MAG: RNA polymerase sigma factor (sigma-70 family) [Saprospiraceae bacterium]|jgi:RNA polymerase sigma factor (sigma-70 family)
MERFQEDSELIKVLKGSRIEMNQAITWILKHSGWRDAIGIQIRRFQMDLNIRDEVFYEGLTALTVNVRKEDFQGNSKLKTYFEGICKNILRTRLTKKTRDAQRFVSMETEQIIQKETIDAGEIQESDRQSAIQQTLAGMINKLGENCKRILGYIVLDYSMREIAEKLDMERQSIKNKSLKCRGELREMAIENPGLMNEIKALI